MFPLERIADIEDPFLDFIHFDAVRTLDNAVGVLCVSHVAGWFVGDAMCPMVHASA